MPRHAIFVVLALIAAACGDVTSDSADAGDTGAAGSGPGGAPAGEGGAAGSSQGSAGTTGAAGAPITGVAGAAAGGSSAGSDGARGGSTGAAGAAGGSSGAAGKPVSSIRVPTVETKNALTGPAIAPAFRISNNDTAPLDLARVKLRYWYTADGPVPVAQAAACVATTIAAGCTSVVPGTFAQLIPADLNHGADYYVDVGFKPTAGTLSPPGGPTTSVDVYVSWSKTDGSAFDQSNDWSGSRSSEFTGLQNITVYIDGQKVAGNSL